VIGPTQRPLPDNTQHWQETDINAPGGTQNRSPNNQAATDLPLRPHGHWNGKIRILSDDNSCLTLVLYIIMNLLSLMLSSFWSLPSEAPSGWSWDFPQFRRNLSLLIWLIVLLLSAIRSVAKRVNIRMFEIIFLKLNKYIIKNLNCRLLNYTIRKTFAIVPLSKNQHSKKTK